MKLHKIKTILAVAAMGVLSQSCLDLDPKDQLAESNLWSSPPISSCLPISSTVGRGISVH